MKIYTKTGDAGATGLVGGARVSKSSLRIEAIGAVDELNAIIGWALICAERQAIGKELESIQNWLFEIGSELASPSDTRFETISNIHTESLERSMDIMSADLPELRNFILPGGTEFASRLHIARSNCRRAERAVVRLAESDQVRKGVQVFLNRLADFLFVAARTANQGQNVKDVTWKRGT